MRNYSVEEFERRFDELLGLVVTGEAIGISVRGKPAAVVVPRAYYDLLTAKADANDRSVRAVEEHLADPGLHS